MVSNGIYERISGEVKMIVSINETDADVTGSRIHLEGDVVYSIGYAPI